MDLRCGVTVTSLEGDADGRLRRAHLSDGSVLDVDVAVAALGGVRNVEWLQGSGLAAGVWGVACDAGCRAFDVNGLVTDDVFVAGDVARAPHPMFGYQFLALEHWGNAVSQAEIAAHNMVSAEARSLAAPVRAGVLVGAVRRRTSSPSACPTSRTRWSSRRGRWSPAASSPPTGTRAGSSARSPSTRRSGWTSTSD